jgi:hypothetical protein
MSHVTCPDLILKEDTIRLLTEALRIEIPALGATEGQDNPVAICRFFTPDGAWTWLPFEFDGEDTFFGAVSGHEFELGYFSLSELETPTGPFGLHVERDLYYKPMSLSEIRKQYGRRA